jgi:hypothetical protein
LRNDYDGEAYNYNKGPDHYNEETDDYNASTDDDEAPDYYNGGAEFYNEPPDDYPTDNDYNASANDDEAPDYYEPDNDVNGSSGNNNEESSFNDYGATVTIYGASSGFGFASLNGDGEGIAGDGNERPDVRGALDNRRRLVHYWKRLPSLGAHEQGGAMNPQEESEGLKSVRRMIREIENREMREARRTEVVYWSLTGILAASAVAAWAGAVWFLVRVGSELGN